MRPLRRNRKKMYYSLYSETVPTYETDDEGNVIYTLIDGEEVPVETGSPTTVYAEPVEFFGNIHGAGGEAEAQAYGVSLGAYDAVLYEVIGTLPLDETSRIWVNSEPTFNDDGSVRPESADYVVKRVPPSLNEQVYLLAKQEK